MQSTITVLLLILAAFGDTFVLSGFFLYGSLVAAAATTALVMGLSPFVVGVACLAGCVLGETANMFMSKHSKISKLLERHRIRTTNRKANSQNLQTIKRYFKKFKDTRIGAFLSYIAIRIFNPLEYRQGEPFWRTIGNALVGRFLASSRPLNAHFAYQTHGFWKSTLALTIAAAIWIYFWLLVFQNVVTKIFSIF